MVMADWISRSDSAKRNSLLAPLKSWASMKTVASEPRHSHRIVPTSSMPADCSAAKLSGSCIRPAAPASFRSGMLVLSLPRAA
jgi:hypothetical protein